MPKYSRIEKIGIVASTFAAGIFVAFLIGLRMSDRPAAPNAPAAPGAEGPPVAAASQPATAPVVAVVAPRVAVPAIIAPAVTSGAVNREAQRHLDAAEVALGQAMASLQKVPADATGNMEKVAPVLTKAAQDLADAQTYLAQHAQLAAQAMPPVPPMLRSPIARGQGLALAPAIEPLNTALAELQKVPNDLGGLRDKAITDLSQGTTALTVAINAYSVPVNPNLPPTAELLKAALGPVETPARLQPLHFGPAPVGGADLALSTAKLQYRAALPDLANSTVADVLPPLHTFTLYATNLNANNPLAASTDGGYSYLVDAGGKSLVRSVLRINASGRAQVQIVNNTSTYKYMQAIEPALLQLITMEPVKSGSYEPRLLTSTSPVNFQAIWLTSEKGDLIYPLASTSAAVTVQKLYPADEFLKALRSPPPPPPAPAPAPAPGAAPAAVPVPTPTPKPPAAGG